VAVCSETMASSPTAKTIAVVLVAMCWGWCC
jgi:hypothetical protein